jgi:hypothetical protein
MTEDKRALLIGANGPPTLNPLRYANSDAKALAKLLVERRCGYSVAVADASKTAAEARAMVLALAEESEADTTLLCYFSGHGILHHGELYLLLDTTDPSKLLSTTLSVSELVRALEYSRARSKLLILDCCHAGAATALGMKSGVGLAIEELGIPKDHFLILMASGRLEQARELPLQKGSFLTSKLIDGLSSEGGRLRADRNGDGEVSMDDMIAYLADQATRHNTQVADKATPVVPIPQLFGRQRSPYLFTRRPLTSWTPMYVSWVEGIELVVLPVATYLRAEEGGPHIACLSRHPITNGQYRRFVKSTGHPEPAGEVFVRNRWRGRWQKGFRPWQSPQFRDDDKPVVCISKNDADAYCRWLWRRYTPDERVGGVPRLPSRELWDYGGFGSTFHTNDPTSWLQSTATVHHRSSEPAEVDRAGDRTNRFGLSDMFGNVWEWCASTPIYRPRRRGDPFSFESAGFVDLGVLVDHHLHCRGGSYLDDLEYVMPFRDEAQLRSGADTRHADLGFRLACRIRVRALPHDSSDMLAYGTWPDVYFATD